MQYIAFDAHKHYTIASVEQHTRGVVREMRLAHERGVIRDFLRQCDPGSPVAVETVGNWYWLVDEIEGAGMMPQLVNTRKAKLILGAINKTDKLDVRGLNRLQRTGTLPTVWIPSAEVRDQRDLPRTRMVLTRARTRLKNRIHATLAKYALSVSDGSDLFGQRARALLTAQLAQLPPYTRFATERLLEQLEDLDGHIAQFEARMREAFKKTPDLELITTLPGVGMILGLVIVLEVGDVRRFPDAAHLAAYAGTTPRVDASGGKVRFGRLRPDVNHYLKWAYAEAANVICGHRAHWPHRHVVLFVSVDSDATFGVAWLIAAGDPCPRRDGGWGLRRRLAEPQVREPAVFLDLVLDGQGLPHLELPRGVERGKRLVAGLDLIERPGPAVRFSRLPRRNRPDRDRGVRHLRALLDPLEHALEGQEHL